MSCPKYLNAIRDKKTDKKNARWIADLFKHDLVAGSFMPHFAFAGYVILCDTVLSWHVLPPARRTGCKIALLYQIFKRDIIKSCGLE